jgi:hypothetical protein
MMPYFDEMVAAFMETEERGCCLYENERKYVNIKCVIVADMSFLHKYLNRGGGSVSPPLNFLRVQVNSAPSLNSRA